MNVEILTLQVEPDAGPLDVETLRRGIAANARHAHTVVGVLRVGRALERLHAHRRRGGVDGGGFELVARPVVVDHRDVPLVNHPAEHRLGEVIVDDGRDRAPQRPGAVFLVKASLEKLVHRRRGESHLHALEAHATRRLTEHQARDALHGLLLQLLEAHDLVEAVEHLRSEEVFELVKNLLANALVLGGSLFVVILELEPEPTAALGDHLAAHV
mmetsp:Transcript_1311/g.5364  ORF Transcript_1311/g.5364 Transcript_1311/m.5364 type:complete len:214 (+) Transcript_1311:744-1385(+)